MTTSSTSRFRLLAPLCGALLLVNAPLALAQDNQDNASTPEYPAPAASPEAAGERFYQFLSAGVVTNDASARATFNWPGAERYGNAVSRAQMMEISGMSQSGGPERLFALLAQQKDEPQFKGEVVGKEGEQTLVEVAPAPARKRAVVVVPEDGGFRVDVKATYGRWNDLSGEKLDIAWADYTNIISPALAKNTTFIEKRARASCQVNLKQAMLGVLQYSQDYDETYPTARKWIDDVMPYVQSQQVFRCPALPDGDNYGYALNQNLNTIKMAQLDNVAQTVAIYETSDLTRNAFGSADERAYRHGGGSNIAFADGHIKWYAEGQEPEGEVSFKP